MKIFKTRDELCQSISTHYELQFLILQRISDLANESLEEVVHFYVTEGPDDLDALPVLSEIRSEYLH